MRVARHETMLQYKDTGFFMQNIHESENLKVLSFTFRAGQSLPLHSHDLDGELTITVLAGRGEFLGAEGVTLPAEPGDVLIARIREPHGIQAGTDMTVLVTIAPPI